MPRTSKRKNGNGRAPLFRAPYADVEKQSLAGFTEKAYLDYSMYVILDRALPNLADGLKPVQRRIIYAMSELGLSANAKFKKSARTVGDVLGKYHPHGDTACYEAMVLMAQPFSLRYPLVDGQGNWGSQDDPKSFAAMRYTESRMTPFAQSLLSELEQGTVEWGPNFDGTLEEPKLLPARLPHVILNGASGIAVGMATDIPPHNVGEVVGACIKLLDDPKTSDEEIYESILGPDFPTDAEIITPRSEIRKIYETGSGSLRLRASFEIEDGDIVVTALPFQVSGSKILGPDRRPDAGEKAAHGGGSAGRVRSRKPDAPRDHSALEPGGRRRFDGPPLRYHRPRANLPREPDDDRPRRPPPSVRLRELLGDWLKFRVETVRRRLQFRYDKVLTRLHILDGYLIAYLNIDEVIRIIRTEDVPEAEAHGALPPVGPQAEAILELKLRHLAKLEEMEIRSEQSALAKERDSLAKILSSDTRLRRKVRDELIADAEKFGDARRSPIVEREAAKAMDETALIPTEPVTVVLSEKGWVRAGKGHDLNPKELSYKAGDAFLMAARGRSNQSAVFLDSTGRTYSMAAHALPSARGQGEPLSSHVQPPPGANFVGVMIGGDEDLYLMATSAGYGFIAKLGDLQTRQRAGKAMMTVPEGAKVLPPIRVRESGSRASGRRERRWPTADLPPQGPATAPPGQGGEDSDLSFEGRARVPDRPRRADRRSPPPRPLRQALPEPQDFRLEGVRRQSCPAGKQAAAGVSERGGAGGAGEVNRDKFLELG